MIPNQEGAHSRNFSMKRFFVIIICLLYIAYPSKGQSIVDSCFTSVTAGTDFSSSFSLANMGAYQADVLEWNGSSWIGGWPGANLTIPPPIAGFGCRAIFLGNGTTWTSGGEGFGARFTPALIAGQTYAISFTYVSHGTGSTGSFSPELYTNNSGSMGVAYLLGSLPAVGYAWTTNTYTFTATAAQAGHNWFILHTGPTGTSGLINSFCSDCSSTPTTCSIDLGNDTTLCQGATLVLNASTPGASYLWQNNSTNPTFTVTQAGTYYVQVIFPNACIARDTIVVNYTPLPVVNLGNNTSICQGSTLTLDATLAGASYLWQDNSTNPTYAVTQAGNYSVTVTVNQCSASDAINVLMNPSPIVDLGNDTSICQGETLTLDATTSNASYLWQDNSSAASLSVSTQGTYWVSVTVSGCSSSDSITVLSIPYPSPSLGNDTTLCQGSVLLLDANTMGASYLWQDQSINPTFTVSQQGTYWMVVTIGNCSGSDTINVNFVTPPAFNLGNDTSLCEGTSMMLDATTPGASYVWQDNNQAPNFEINQEGDYWVNVTLNGCTVADTIIVDYLTNPVAQLGNDTIICEGVQLVLEVTSPDLNCIWMNEVAGPIFIVHQEGSYWVETSNSCGLDRDTLNVGVTICDCPVYIADAFTPNNDFVNDEFSPKTNCEYILYSFVVFDRWGEKVFETDQSSNAWDGTYHGKVVPAGIYVYHLTYRFEMAPELVRCGTVTIIR